MTFSYMNGRITWINSGVLLSGVDVDSVVLQVISIVDFALLLVVLDLVDQSS